MNKKSTIFSLSALGFLLLSSFTIIEDLSDQVSGMKEGDKMLLEYSFEGCYGPYHHGTIDMSFKNDTIFYVEKSFDHTGKNPITQAGKYERSKLLHLLNQAGKKKSDEVLGNTITYRLSSDSREILKGADRIEQRHFIELFHPFTSIFPPAQEEVIPGLKTGGFVH